VPITPRRVAVVGVALSDTGRVDTLTPFHLHAQAAQRAIADAGLTKADIDGLASNGQGTLNPIEVGEYLGLRPTWVDSTGVGGGTWEVMAGHAADAIAMGHADVVVLVYGSTTRADLKNRRRTANLSFGARGPVQYEVPYGHTIIAKYAMATRRHMHEYGTTIEQLAEIAVSARYNAGFNPDAYYRDPITIDDVIGGPMIADPFTKLQCCIRSDGGCAVVLAAEDRVADCRTTPVWILGHGQAVSHTTMSEWPDFTTGPAAAAGRHAFGRAGVTPADIDVACIYDAFTGMLLFTLEDLGFCAKGEGGPFVEGGRLRLGGELPTNPDGGGLSACHPGMRGLFLLVEATRQLRGDYAAAGTPERQVPDAKLAVASGTGGWFCSNGTLILGRE
jgi:acetyl-CoA acetyltransferase